MRGVMDEFGAALKPASYGMNVKPLLKEACRRGGCCLRASCVARAGGLVRAGLSGEPLPKEACRRGGRRGCQGAGREGERGGEGWLGMGGRPLLKGACRRGPNKRASGTGVWGAQAGQQSPGCATRVRASGHWHRRACFPPLLSPAPPVWRSKIFGTAGGVVDMLVRHLPSSRAATAAKVERCYTGEAPPRGSACCC